jgi:hypothetical protein
MMARGPNRLAIRGLKILFSAGSLRGLSDGELPDRDVSRRDEIVLFDLERKTHRHVA